MHFGQKVVFMVACLGIAVITQPIGPIKIAIYRKNEMRKCIAEKRARVAKLGKEFSLEKRLWAVFNNNSAHKQPLRVKKFRFADLFPKDSHKESTRSENFQRSQLPELKPFDFDKPWYKKDGSSAQYCKQCHQKKLGIFRAFLFISCLFYLNSVVIVL